MADVTVQGDQLVVSLGRWEKVAALHGDLRIPLAAVHSVTVLEDPLRAPRGIRAPGTGLPGVVAMGTWRRRDGNDFLLVRRKQPAVHIALSGRPYANVIIGLDDPHAVAAEIHAALEAG